MFLKCVTELPVAFDAVRATMLSGECEWLTGLAESAAGSHDQLLVEVGLGPGGREPSGPAVLEVGRPMALGDRVLSLPIRLEMAERTRLFPILEGGIDAAWVGEGRTHLALTGQYEPPLGLLGLAADAILLHRVAELVGQRFLEAVAHRLAGETPGPASCVRQPASGNGGLAAGR